MKNAPSRRVPGVFRFANKMHVALYRLSSGKFANRIANMPILLLTSVGRRSHKPATHPVVFLRDGRDYVVSASMGGMKFHPGWYFNVKDNPAVTVQVGGETFEARARVTAGAERDRLYEQFKAASANFVKYEQTAGRVIPVIRLTPVGS